MCGKMRLCLILIVLVISLPLVHATELSVLSISGEEGVPGRFNPGDMITMVAQASVDNDQTVTSDQIIVYIDGQRTEIFSTPGNFNSCTETSNQTFQCTYERPAPSSGKYEYEIRLYNDFTKSDVNAQPLRTVKKSIYSDTRPPEVDLTLTPIKTPDAVLNIEEEAQDYAVYNDNNLCTGITTVEFYLDSITGTPYRTAEGGNACLQSIAYEHRFSGIKEGAHTVFAKATDVVGQEGLASKVFYYDKTGPHIAKDVTFYYSNTGSKVIWINPNIITTVDASVEIKDTNLDKNSVVGDFSEMTDKGFSEVSPIFSGNNAVFRNIDLSATTKCRVRIKAADMLGTETETVITCKLKKDGVGPKVTSWKTTNTYEGTNYLGSTGQIKVKFNEAGIGLDSQEVYLDLESINGLRKVPASACDQSGNSWECIWDVAPVSDGVKIVRVHPDTTDKLGNRVQNTETRETEITVDTTAPIISSVNYKNILGENAIPAVIKGSSIELVMFATNYATAEIDGRSLGIQEPIIPTCDAEKCTATVEVGVSGPSYANVIFKARDEVGNEAKKPLKIEIWGLVEEEPNQFKATSKCSPSSIDRQVTPLIPVKVFCDVKLTPLVDGVTVHDVVFDGMGTCAGEYQSVISELSIFNEGINPLFSMKLFATEYSQSGLNMTCPLKIFAFLENANGKYVATIPEIEQVPLGFSFANQPLGTAYEQIDKKVDETVKEAKEYMSWVGKLNKLIRMLEGVCRIKSALVNIMGAVNALTIVMGFSSTATKATGNVPTGAALEKQYNALCSTGMAMDSTYGGMFGMLDKMCTFLNCRAGDDKDYLGKLGGGASHCKYIKDLLGKISFAEGVEVPDIRDRYVEYNSQVPQSIDVKDSLIMSSICLCVPGIIHNLNKLREIKCQKALCYLKEVKEGGIPPSFCDETEDYLMCNYIVGDIFRIFPIMNMWDQVTGIIKRLYANPFQAVTVIAAVKCKDFCNGRAEFVAQYKSCMAAKIAAKIGDAIGSINAYNKIKDDFSGDSSFCEQLDKISEEENKILEDEESEEKGSNNIVKRAGTVDKKDDKGSGSNPWLW